VLTRAGHEAGDYTLFAASVENMFAPAYLAALDEYGIPLQVALKLEAFVSPYSGLDALLDRMRQVDLSATGLSDFEQSLVAAARARF
jgi:hypothetical protein